MTPNRVSFNYVVMFIYPVIFTAANLVSKYLREEEIVLSEAAFTAFSLFVTVGSLELYRVLTRNWNIWVRCSVIAILPVSLMSTLLFSSGPLSWWSTMAFSAVAIGAIPVLFVAWARLQSSRSESE